MAKIAPFFNAILQLDSWRNVKPGLHQQGPQGHIDQELPITEYDVVVAIFWQRLGTPTATGETGTEHETRSAYRHWAERGRPQLMLYFNRYSKPSLSIDELQQMLGVAKLREEFEAKGLVRNDQSLGDFRDFIRDDLTTVLMRAVNLNRNPGGIPCAFAATPYFVRGESVAELIGEFALIFPPQAGVKDVEADVHLLLNTNLTNKVAAGNRLPEAQLWIEYPEGVNATAPPPVSGRIIGINEVLFERVRVPLSQGSESVTLRISGVRANASLLTLSGMDRIVCYAKVVSRDMPINVLNPQVALAECLTSYSVSVSACAFSKRDGVNAAFAADESAPPEITLSLGVQARSPRVLRNREAEGGGRTSPLDSGIISGTLIEVEFTCISEAVQIYAAMSEKRAAGEPPKTRLIFPVDGQEVIGKNGEKLKLLNIEPPIVCTHPDGSRYTEGFSRARAVWEWIGPQRPTEDRSAASPQYGAGPRFEFGFALVARPGAAPLGSALITCNIGPVSWFPTASMDAPIPRFILPNTSQAAYRTLAP